MCALERNTFNRGRICVPDTLARTRTCRRLRGLSAFLYLTRMLFHSTTARPEAMRRLLGLACLARLATDHFAFVPNPLALVGFRRPDPANSGGLFTNALLVYPGNGDAIIAFHGKGDAIGRLNSDRMRVADIEDE